MSAAQAPQPRAGPDSATLRQRHAKMVAAATWLADLRFAQIGWAPLADGKAPRRRWKSDATDDPALVPGLLHGARNALVIPQGRGLVVDADDERAWQELAAAGLPETFMIASPTAGHGHAYLWAPGDLDMRRIPGSFEWGEIRRSTHDGRTSSMVLGPYSMRSDGIYTPANGCREIATLPASVLEYLIGSQGRKKTRETSARSPEDPGWYVTSGRHEHLQSRARWARGNGLTGEQLLEFLVRLDRDRHRPPIADEPGRGLDEIRRIGEWSDQHIADDPPAVGIAFADRAGDARGVHAARDDDAETPPHDSGERPRVEQKLPRWRTLADVPDTPPAPLLLGIIEPDGQTLAYGAPGVGKGTTGAYIVTEAQRLGMLPCIFDAERRPREWARRVSGLGGDRSRVIYLEPPDLGRSLAGRPLWEAVGALGAAMRSAGADLLIVDSILPAVGVGEERLRSDAQAPYLFVGALDALGVPSLSFGHPPKGQPEGEPFGSMAWVAAMRLTWLGTSAEGDGHRIRWRPRKRNERGYIGGVLLTVTYGDDGRPMLVEREDDDESTREWLLAALVHRPRSVADLAEELADASEEPVDRDRLKERLRKALGRMAREGLLQREGPGTGPNVRWSLRWEKAA